MFTLLFAGLLFSHHLVASPAPSLAITVVESGLSTTTANPFENHLKRGAELALRMKLVGASKVAWIDQGENTETTLSAIAKLNALKPRIVVGLGTSSQALLAAQLLTQESVLITPLATSDEILTASKRIILISNSNSIQAKLLGSEMMARVKPGQNILIVEVVGCPYCSNMAHLLTVDLQKRGLKPVTTKILSSQINELRSILSPYRNFSHIALPVLEAESARFIDALYPGNPTATFWGGDGWGTLARNIRELPYVKGLKMFWLSHYYERVNTKENREFIAKYRRAFEMTPIDTSAQYYEAVQLALRIGQEKMDPIAAFQRIKLFKGLMGVTKVIGNHVERPMPLLTMVDGQIRMQKLLGPCQ